MDFHLFAFMSHLVGFALGLGGATVSDVIFFKMLRGGKFVAHDLRILHTLSKIIWVGLGLLIASGLAMFAAIYSDQGSLPMLLSPRWQAKLTFVAIVFLNGLAFKYLVVPFLVKNKDQAVSQDNIGRNSWLLAITGSISIVSWYSILVVSALPREFKPLFIYFIGVYLVLVILGAITGRLILLRSIKQINPSI